MAEAERGKAPEFLMSEKHTICSVCKLLFGTIYGIQKRDFVLRTLEISRDDRMVVCAEDKSSQGDCRNV